jgi:large subunit ribosomal protein L24
MANKFKKGDQVRVITGEDKGKISKIIQVIDSKVLIEGVNIATIHKKPNSKEPGQIIKKEKPIHISNISHVDNNKNTKIKFEISSGDGKNFTRKKRIYKKTDKKI